MYQYFVSSTIILFASTMSSEITQINDTEVSFYDSSLPFPSFNLELRTGLADTRFRSGRRLGDNDEYRQLGNEMAPLYQGLGVHYSYIWVGTPPQRVSVILDTGSHHTAFPCTGCKCGKHNDPYWDPKKSSTSKILKCAGNKNCVFSQRYTEGSSWKAFKVKDRIWSVEFQCL